MAKDELLIIGYQIILLEENIIRKLKILHLNYVWSATVINLGPKIVY